MSNDKSQTARTSGTDAVLDTAKESMLKAIDELAKFQPQYAQSFTNLQFEYIHALRNTIKSSIQMQKQMTDKFGLQIPFAEQYKTHLNDFAASILRALTINNQLAINALDTTRENINIYNRLVYALMEFNTSFEKTMISFHTLQEEWLKKFRA